MVPQARSRSPANYVHTDLDSLPYFGVPHKYVRRRPPGTSLGVPRDTYYGFVNRDFQKTQQDIVTVNGEVAVNDFVTVDNKFRVERAVLNYIGTIPEQSASIAKPCTTVLRTGPTSNLIVADGWSARTSVTW